jgi:hypothetical protein
MPDDRFLHKRAGHSEKVNMLTDLEFRVWAQYLISADDFGVMRASAVTLQADNDHLSNRPAKVIQRCIEALVKPDGLLRTFEHQGRRYIYQHDWQSWQKVSYPRTTNNPKPPEEALAGCDEPTQKLFAVHPGGAGRTRSNGSKNIPETVPEHFPLTRAGAPAKRLTANGERLTAHGFEEDLSDVTTLPPMDVWARELINLYPKEGRCGWNLVERPLFAALTSIMTDQGLHAANYWDAWDWLKARLEQHKRSHNWRERKMIKRLDRWLSEGVYWSEPAEGVPPAVASGASEPEWVQRARAAKAKAAQS